MLTVVRAVAQYNHNPGNLLKLQWKNKLQNQNLPLSLATHSLSSSNVYCQMAVLQLAVLTVGSNDSWHLLHVGLLPVKAKAAVL